MNRSNLAFLTIALAAVAPAAVAAPDFEARADLLEKEK